MTGFCIALAALSLVAPVEGDLHCDGHGDADCTAACACVCCPDAALVVAACETAAVADGRQLPVADALRRGRVPVADIFRPPAAS